MEYNSFEKVFAFLIFILVFLYLMSKFGELIGFVFDIAGKLTI